MKSTDKTDLQIVGLTKIGNSYLKCDNWIVLELDGGSMLNMNSVIHSTILIIFQLWHQLDITRCLVVYESLRLKEKRIS